VDLSSIKKEHTAYIRAKEKTTQLRSQWPTARKVILDTLNHIKAEVQMDVKIKVEDKMEGMEVIYLSYGKEDSGIFEKIGKTKRPVIKEGGHLFYTQLYNGKVGVWKTLPNIKKLMNAQAPQKLGLFEPEEITEELIISQVAEFLQSLATWEDKDLENGSIGYKMK